MKGPRAQIRGLGEALKPGPTMLIAVWQLCSACGLRLGTDAGFFFRGSGAGTGVGTQGTEGHFIYKAVGPVLYSWL